MPLCLYKPKKLGPNGGVSYKEHGSFQNQRLLNFRIGFPRSAVRPVNVALGYEGLEKIVANFPKQSNNGFEKLVKLLSKKRINHMIGKRHGSTLTARPHTFLRRLSCCLNGAKFLARVLLQNCSNLEQFLSRLFK